MERHWTKAGEELRAWRKTELGVSQEVLAEDLGCSRHYVSMLETGASRPGFDLGTKIEAMGGPKFAAWKKDEEREAA